jgi:hypothetical protein
MHNCILGSIWWLLTLIALIFGLHTSDGYVSIMMSFGLDASVKWTPLEPGATQWFHSLERLQYSCVQCVGWPSISPTELKSSTSQFQLLTLSMFQNATCPGWPSPARGSSNGNPWLDTLSVAWGTMHTIAIVPSHVANSKVANSLRVFDWCGLDVVKATLSREQCRNQAKQHYECLESKLK